VLQHRNSLRGESPHPPRPSSASASPASGRGEASQPKRFFDNICDSYAQIRWLIASVKFASIPRATLATILLFLATPTHADESLYRAQTIVTGTAEPNRLIGFAACLEDALIKVSGQLRLAGDPRLAPYKQDAAKFVRDYSYRDEKGGKPVNDEQGTRDRSFVLTVDFDEAAINNALAALGSKPWLARRPVVAVFAELQLSARRYVVAADSKDTDLQKQALLAAAFKRGLSLVLPEAATLQALGANEAKLASLPPAKLAAAAAKAGGEVVLIAGLVWDEQALRWNAAWRLASKDGTQKWLSSAVTYDEAFRQGLGGAAQIMSIKQ
jgi:hypothetical protein